MKAEIINVGTEILIGDILNTHSQFLSSKLAEFGIDLYYHTVVGDNNIRLKEVFELALKRSEFIILTGGLGPTADDITKETVAKSLNLPLYLHEESLERIKNYMSGFRYRNQENGALNPKMPESNKKQAFVPEGARVLNNNNGTAPGIFIEKDNKKILILPGPPKELEPMFLDFIKEFRENEMIFSKYLKIFGIGESLVEQTIKDLIDNQTDPTIAPYAKEGEVVIRITTKCKDKQEGEEKILPLEREIRNRIDVYGTDKDTLWQVVVKLLTDKKLSVATAESCTGGLLAGKITSVPGASECFKTGFITYSNEAKNKYLNVSLNTLESFGAVSGETAIEMAKGAQNSTGADIGIGITGIAGPGGGSHDKPVGLVYIALVYGDLCVCNKINIPGNRERIRNFTVLTALNMIRKNIII